MCSPLATSARPPSSPPTSPLASGTASSATTSSPPPFSTVALNTPTFASPAVQATASHYRKAQRRRLGGAVPLAVRARCAARVGQFLVATVGQFFVAVDTSHAGTSARAERARIRRSRTPSQATCRRNRSPRAVTRRTCLVVRHSRCRRCVGARTPRRTRPDPRERTGCDHARHTIRRRG